MRCPLNFNLSLRKSAKRSKSTTTTYRHLASKSWGTAELDGETHGWKGVLSEQMRAGIVSLFCLPKSQVTYALADTNLSNDAYDLVKTVSSTGDFDLTQNVTVREARYIIFWRIRRHVRVCKQSFPFNLRTILTRLQLCADP